VSVIAAIGAMFRDKRFEVGFAAVLSVLISAIFYLLISMNGVILGNDPAVHLEKAQIFLNTGEISLANIGWTPPLYQIVLAMFISLSGVTYIGQMIFLVKVVAVICDWLLIFSAYLIASKFFDKRVGVVAAILLLMCFPIYEANQFGGYTTVLALAFMLLVFLYTPLAVERFGYLAVTFFVAFGLVLSHQLAAFLAVFIMPPILLYMLIKSRGAHFNVVAAIFLGGGIAFFLYYFTAMIGYMDVVIKYVFFAIKAYAYQIPATTFHAFTINFGFILFLAVAGVAIACYQLYKRKKPLIALILLLNLFVPLFFALSYLFGLYMPFAWFIYYLTPPLAILAAVSTVFLIDKGIVFYSKRRQMFKKNWVRALAVLLVVLLSVIVVYRSDVVYGRIMEASVYYSTTDIKAYDAGIWLKANYPQNSTIITTYVPGFWFQGFTGMNVIAQTEQAVQRNEIAEATLTLSYELEHEHTLVKAYEAKGDILDETYISTDHVWDRISFSSGTGDFLSYTLQGINYDKLPLSTLNKQIVFSDKVDPKEVVTIFTDDNVALTKTITFHNNTYQFTINWTLTPLKSQIENASLYITKLFDLKYHFNVVHIPGLLDWINPWHAPNQIKNVHNETGNDWAVAGFFNYHLKDNYVGFYNEKDEIGYAYKFNDLPDWGNVGALGNLQIDALRFQYNFGDIEANRTTARSYQTLSMTKNSYTTLERDSLLEIFDLKYPEFIINSRDFTDYIRENNVSFLVYDRNQLDISMIHSRLLQLIYSNDRYVIFKIVT
jgi:hypothetical protein